MKLGKSFLPQVIYEGSTQYNNDIKVIKVGKTLKLIVNGIVQSLNNTSRFAKKRVWGEIAKIIYKEKPNTKNLLLLGMAGGTMIHFLNEAFGSENINITSVEIDPVIADLAKKYFGMDKAKNNKIIVTDAARLVENPEKYGANEKFDCIVVDTFCGDEHPEEIQKIKFYENVKKMLNDGGLVVINKIVFRKTPKKVVTFKVAVEKVFGNVKVKKVNCGAISDNFIFYVSR